MLSVANKPIMLSVVMLNVVMLSVVALKIHMYNLPRSDPTVLYYKTNYRCSCLCNSQSLSPWSNICGLYYWLIQDHLTVINSLAYSLPQY